MTTYISILRGINVGGKKLIKMDALRTMLEILNFKNIRTYVQSGNVIFSIDNTDVKELADKISKLIEKELQFVVPVIVLTKETLKEIIDQNPFAKDPDKEMSNMHVTFLADKPNEYDETIVKDKMQVGEEIHFASNAVYLYLPKGYSETKLNNNFLEKKLKVVATTRNWKTTNELLNIATQ